MLVRIRCLDGGIKEFYTEVCCSPVPIVPASATLGVVGARACELFLHRGPSPPPHSTLAPHPAPARFKRDRSLSCPRRGKKLARSCGPSSPARRSSTSLTSSGYSTQKTPAMPGKDRTCLPRARCCRRVGRQGRGVGSELARARASAPSAEQCPAGKNTRAPCPRHPHIRMPLHRCRTKPCRCHTVSRYNVRQPDRRWLILDKPLETQLGKHEDSASVRRFCACVLQ